MPFFSLELIKFHSVFKHYGPKTVLEDVSFTLNCGQRYALIGENGSGKTTLARLIMSIETPDEGKVWIAPQSRTGYLPQDTIGEQDHLTVQEFLFESQGRLNSISCRMRELENLMAFTEESRELDQITSEWDELFTQFTTLGGYQAQENLQNCLNALKLGDLPLNLKLFQLSEGEKRRVYLAGLLLKEVDILILDEPTNHLDQDALIWLENYLRHFRGALILISHDRHFLNQIATSIVELSASTHQLKEYQGNYDDYLIAKKNEFSRQLEAFENQKEEIASLKRFLKEQSFSMRKAPPPKDANKMAYDYRGERNVQSKRKVISQAKQRLELLKSEALKHPIPKDYRGIFFKAKQPLEASFAMMLEEVDIEIGGKLLISNFSATVNAGERIILSGPNGSGKSTLLRLLASSQQPKKGKILFSTSTRIGFLPQEILFEDEHLTLLEYLQRNFSLPEHELRSRLHQIALIEDAFIRQRIETLSVGQKRRLQLLTLMLEEGNVLLLDEPTNHLAPHHIDQLEEALLRFDGTVIVATHDRRFSSKVGTKTWSL